MNNLNLITHLLSTFAGQFIAGNLWKATPSVKNIIRTLRFRTCWYSDDHRELDRIFQALTDPWNFESSPYERERLQLLLQRAMALPHDSVCEVGCAEGVFTQMLSAVCHHVTGIDVSPTAIDRARDRCPAPTYLVTSLEAFQTRKPFDLVICAETLYYIKDVTSAIEKLSMLGRYCMVSYVEREARLLDRFFTEQPNVRMEKFELGKGPLRRKMSLVIWENPLPGD